MTKKTIIKYFVIAIILIGALIGIKFLIDYFVDIHNAGFYGTYVGYDLSIKIDDNGFSIDDGINKESHYFYNVTNERITWGDNVLYRHENGEILTMGPTGDVFFNGACDVLTRNGTFDGRWIASSNGQILLEYEFHADGTFSHRQPLVYDYSTGTYMIKNGLVTLYHINNFNNIYKTDYYYIDNEMRLHAFVVAVRSHDIIYDLDGGSLPPNVKHSITINDGVYTLPIPTKEGYTFMGWYEKPSFKGDPITEIKCGEYKNEYKLYAKFSNDPNDFLIFNEEGNKQIVTGFKNNPTSLEIPRKFKGYLVTRISDDAFKDCVSLTHITIPDSITCIDDRAFLNCGNLASVNYLGTIEQWCGITLDSPSANPLHNGAKLYLNGEPVTELVIPNGVTTIKDYAFYGCDSLTSVTIGNSVTNIGSEAFNSCDNLTSVTIGNSVTSIGSCAFYNCDGLTSVTIPNSVTSIGYYAFYGCTSLTKVNYTGTIDQWVQIEFVDSYSNPLSNANDLYINNELVTEANITTATSINAYAFCNYHSLTSVTIGNSVTSIGEMAFHGCGKLVEVYNLSSLSITAGNSNYGAVGYFAKNVYTPTSGKSKLSTDSDGCTIYTDEEDKILVGYVGNETELRLQNDITQIYAYAFSSCNSLTSVIIPDSVTSIGSYALSGCKNLKQLTLPNNPNLYPSTSMWKDCENLETIIISKSNSYYMTYNGDIYSKDGSTLIACATGKSGIFQIPDFVTQVRNDAISYCNKLTEIIIPNTVLDLEVYAINSCDNLQYITIYANDAINPYGCNKLKYNVYDHVAYLGNEQSPYHIAVDIAEPAETIKIHDNCVASNIYFSAWGIKNIVLGDSLTQGISDSEFDDAYSLTNIYIGNSIPSIGNYAFRNLKNLCSVVIGNSVTSIGDSAFSGCSILTSVTLGRQIKNIGYAAFTNTNITTVYYAGTQTEWELININHVGNAKLTNATRYYYSETEPTEQGNYWHYVDGVVTIWE